MKRFLLFTLLVTAAIGFAQAQALPQGLGIEISTPSGTPSAGTEYYYIKTGAGLCTKTSSGSEICASTGGIPNVFTTEGQLVYQHSSAATALNVGTNGACLVSNGTDPVWGSCSGTGNPGTVTSVAMTLPSFLSLTGSPITTAGTLAVTLASETANTFHAAPNGSAGAPTFRLIVAADLPSSITSSTSGTAAKATAAATTPTLCSTGQAPTGITANFNATGCAAIGSLGTVTSVGLTLPSVFAVTGSPVTTSGTLAASFATGQTANEFLATPNGSSGAVGLRAIVAADLPSSITSTTTGKSAGVTGFTTPTAAGSATLTQTIQSGSLSLATSSIAGPGCQAVTAGSVNSAAATGVVVGDRISWNSSGSLTSTTGFVPSTNGGLTIEAYASAGYVNFDVCNWSASPITPGSVTIEWGVTR